jgi:pyruvate formate lyase activating enzyme
MDYKLVTGTVFNIQRYSIDDGPGVRTTVFLKGCPLRCRWCSNPESQSFERQLCWRYTSCKGCGRCVSACPAGALTLADGGIMHDADKCALCGKCTERCLYDALSISGKVMTAQNAFDVIKRDADYYGSDGGCTCSGGEILSQPDFTAAVFRLCRENGIGTNADTSGFGSREALKKVMEYADMFYYDLKALDPEIHRRWTGVDNAVIIDNLKYLAASGIPTVIRVPLIPGVNCAREQIDELAGFVGSIMPGAEISLLPYHEYGKNKYRMVGMTYAMPETPELTQEQKDMAVGTVLSHGLRCRIS